jgi:hypothetical protein
MTRSTEQQETPENAGGNTAFSKAYFLCLPQRATLARMGKAISQTGHKLAEFVYRT